MKIIGQTLEIRDGNQFVIINGQKVLVTFRYIVYKYLYDHLSNKTVELAKVIQESAVLNYIEDTLNIGRSESLEYFKTTANPLGEIIPTYNCHGFTLTEGQFFIDDEQATVLYNKEYIDCEENDCEIIVFKNSSGICLHSGKYNNSSRVIIHKKGIRELASNTLNEILNIPTYSNLKPYYLRKI